MGGGVGGFGVGNRERFLTFEMQMKIIFNKIKNKRKAVLSKLYT